MRALVTILFLLALSFFARASGDSAVYMRYDANNGLPSNNVYMCLQDHLGYMWFATDKGVVKYDGYEFKVFNTSDGLPNEDVWKLQEDNKGRIWLYTVAESFGYIKDDKYHELHMPGAYKPVYPSRIATLRDGRCMFAFTIRESRDRGICYVDDTSCTVKKFSLFINNEMSYLNLSDDGKAYAMTDNKMYDASLDGNVSTLKLKCVSEPGFNFLFGGFHYDVMGSRYIIFFSVKSHIIRFCDLQNCQMHEVDLAGIHKDTAEYYYVLFNETNELTIITNKHIFAINNPTLAITNEEDLKEIPFKPTQVSCRFKDRDNNVWYTSNSDGVLKKCTGVPKVMAVKLPTSARYVGNVTGGRYYWWEDKEDMLYEMTSTEKLRTRRIAGHGALRHISLWDDSVLCASFANGIYLVDMRTGKMTSFLEEKKIAVAGYAWIDNYAKNNIPTERAKNSVVENPFYTFRVDEHTAYTCNSLNTVKITMAADSVRLTKLAESRFVDCIYDSALKKIYTYKKEGISEIDIATDNVRAIGTNIPGFPRRIFTVQKDRFHNLYIQSESAIYRYNLRSGSFSELPLNLALTNAIVRVEDDNLLVGGKFGLAVVKLNENGYAGSFSYMMNGGLYAQLMDLVLAKDGTVYCKTDKGYIYTTANKIAENGRRFDTRNPLFRLTLKDSTYTEIKSRDTLQLTPSGTHITLGGNNLYGHGNLKFDYRIPALDSTWQHGEGEILVDNADPGEYYNMEVVMRDEHWKSDPYIILLYRRPYWYQTTSAKVLIWCGVVVVVVLFVLTIIYFTRRYVARANEKRQQLTDLELRAIHSQINPHFIFNTLSTALYFINRNEMEAAYQHVNKFSHLLRSYLKSSQERYISLAEEIEMLKKYIELQQSRFGEEFEFVLTVDNKLPINHMQIPSLLLQPLVENAINHGLFHKKGKGILKMAFEQGANNEELICTIDDNGVGRKEASAINAANEFKKESYGSKLTKGLIDIFEQYEQMNIDISYTDKQAPETGTVVTLVIKNIKYVTV